MRGRDRRTISSFGPRLSNSHWERKQNSFSQHSSLHKSTEIQNILNTTVWFNDTNEGGEPSRSLVTSVVGAVGCKMQSKLHRTVLQNWKTVTSASVAKFNQPTNSIEMMSITKEMKYRRFVTKCSDPVSRPEHVYLHIMTALWLQPTQPKYFAELIQFGSVGSSCVCKWLLWQYGNYNPFILCLTFRHKTSR